MLPAVFSMLADCEKVKRNCFAIEVNNDFMTWNRFLPEVMQ
jgi:hypothetical protein